MNCINCNKFKGALKEAMKLEQATWEALQYTARTAKFPKPPNNYRDKIIELLNQVCDSE